MQQVAQADIGPDQESEFRVDQFVLQHQFLVLPVEFP